MHTRRAAMGALAGAFASTADSTTADQGAFIAAAFEMKEQAVRAGDQAYGAVVVRDGEIVGWGPSRVRQHGEWGGHAEREAMRDAQRRLARTELSDCVMYSTSRPCSVCEREAAKLGLARMYFGSDGTDAGTPR
jgi:tRNA(adenine34) deaminase